MALALWAMTATVGPIAGPALGGWITDSYSWSWIFYINIPVGIFAAGVDVVDLSRRAKRRRSALPIDMVGLVSLIAWVGSLQIMLDKGKDLDWFNSPVIVALGVFALVSFAFFVIWELTEKNPVVDLTLFKGRNFLGGTVAISVAYAVFFSNLVLLPQWMQDYPELPLGRCRARHGAARHFRGAARAGDGQDPAEVRRPRARDVGVHRLRRRVLHALALHDRRRYLDARDPDAAAGHPDRALFRAADRDHPVGLAAGEDSGGGGLVELRAGVRGRGRYVACQHGLERPDDPASFATRRPGERHNPAFTDAISSLQTTLDAGTPQALAFFERSLNAQAAMLGLNDIFWLSAVIFIAIIPLIWLTKPGKGAGAGAAGAGGH